MLISVAEEARIIKKYLLAAFIRHAFVSPIFPPPPSPVALALRIHMLHAETNLDQAFFLGDSCLNLGCSD